MKPITLVDTQAAHDLLALIKRLESVSAHNLDGDQIYLAEALCQLKLLSKLSTSSMTMYFYGVPDLTGEHGK